MEPDFCVRVWFCETICGKPWQYFAFTQSELSGTENMTYIYITYDADNATQLPSLAMLTS